MNANNNLSNNKWIKYWLVMFSFLAIMIHSASAEMIPSNRLITWQGNVGVPGGIPNRTENCVTAACNTLYGGTVTTDSINTAIASASGSDTVVRIPAGSYNLTSQITIKTNVVLRGAGMDVTILNFNYTGDGIVTDQQGLGSAVALSSGYTQGSTSVVVADATGLATNNLIILYEDNDPDIAWSRAGKTNIIRQIVGITRVVGTTVSFTPPLVFTFQSGLTPSFKKLTGYSSYIGIEDLTINGSGGFLNNIIWYEGTYGSWIKNIKSTYTDNTHVALTKTLFNEVRDSYFSETTSSNEGYGVTANQLYDYSGANTGLLVENNIFKSLFASGMLNNGTGCVVAYNYSLDGHTNLDPTALTPSWDIQHGPHGLMNLWEGNVGQGIQNDGYHGSGSHDSIFRNHFHGLNETNLSYTANRKIIDLCRFSYYHNVIGNILGNSSWTPTAYEMTGSPTSSSSYIYRLGYPHMGNNTYIAGQPPQGTGDSDASGGFDPKVRATLLRHMNYDYYSSSTKYCGDSGEPGCQGGDGGHGLPKSLYLPSKPNWWGNLRWPAIGPDLNPMEGKIPAQLRYESPRNLRIDP